MWSSQSPSRGTRENYSQCLFVLRRAWAKQWSVCKFEWWWYFWCGARKILINPMKRILEYLMQMLTQRISRPFHRRSRKWENVGFWRKLTSKAWCSQWSHNEDIKNRCYYKGSIINKISIPNRSIVIKATENIIYCLFYFTGCKQRASQCYQLSQ